jgi:hypothetical protein
MAKTVQVVIDVQSDSVKFATDQTLTLVQQVRLLYKELQKVPEGTKEWTTLQKAYNDTKDNLDKVNVKSKELFGTLSTLPGPIGDFSAKLQGGIDLLKVFSSFTLKDLANSFKGVASDIADVFSNITKGNKQVKELSDEAAVATTNLTEFSAASANVAASQANAASATKVLKGGVYGLTIEEQKATATTKGLTVANQELAVAEGAATVATGALRVALQILQATGILLLITGVLAAGKALYDYATSTKGAEEATRNLSNAIAEQQRILANDLSALDQATKIKELRAKLQGKSEKEILQIQMKGGEDRLALLRENDEKIFQQQRELNKNTLINAEDRKKLGDELTAKSLKSNQDIIKQINDNEIASLNLKLKIYTDAKAAGEKANEEQAQRDKKALEDRKAAYREDYGAYEAVLKERREATAFFYNEEKLELAKQRFETGMSEEEYNTKLYIQNIEKNQQLAADEKVVLEGRTAFLKQGLQQKLITQKEYDQYLLDAQRSYNSATNALTTEGYNNDIKLLEEFVKKQQDYKDQAVNINNEIKASWYDLAGSVANSISGLLNVFEQGSDLQKAFAIVSVLINAASAIGKIQLSATESTAEFSKTIATGTATVASGVALLSNPITAIIGAAQVAAGKAAIATGTAGIGAVKANATRQTVGVGLTSAVQIAAILSAKKSGGATAATGGAGAQGTTPSFNGTVTVPAPVIGASQASSTGNLGQTIMGAVQAGNSTSRPIQTYVIGDQISTQQQLDRRISVAAKMGG